jgi:hypothetical protein
MLKAKEQKDLIKKIKQKLHQLRGASPRRAICEMFRCASEKAQKAIKMCEQSWPALALAEAGPRQ